MPDYSYILGSGWWCNGSRERALAHGDDVIRTRDFHHLWYASVTRFTDPEKIVIVDMDSPVPAPLHEDDPRIERIRVPHNPGAPTDHTGIHCGWSVTALLGLQYAAWTDTDYFVYVEQDALLYGEGIVEKCIERMRGPYMFGPGDGTVHPLQQSFFIVRREAIDDFVARVLAIDVPDRVIRPEKKFAMATSPLLRRLPRGLFAEHKHHRDRNWFDRQKVRLHRKALNAFSRFDPLPFGPGGYGSRDPVDFTLPFFYFQHGSAEEIAAYRELIGEGQSSRGG